MICLKLQGQSSASTFLPTSSLQIGGNMTASQNSSAVFLNHAGLVDLNSISVYLSSEQKFGIAGLNSINASFAARLDINSVIGIGIASYGIEDLSQQFVVIAYGRKMSDQFDLSVAFNLNRLDAKELGSSQRFNIEIGSRYRLNERIRLLGFIKNIIPDGGRESQGTSLVALGSQYELDRKVRLYGELLYEGWEDWDVRAGLSYQFQERLKFALGFSSLRSTFHFGFTINLNDQFGIDLASYRHRSLGLSPSIGISFDQ